MQQLPVPQFSSSNPYWRDRRINGVFPAYQPRNSAQDFMYASVWERDFRRDLYGAHCVRMDITAAVRAAILMATRSRMGDKLEYLTQMAKLDAAKQTAKALGITQVKGEQQ